MAVPRLSKEALERLERVSKSRKMTPSQVILKLLPDPEMTAESVLRDARQMTLAEADAILEKHFRCKPKVSEKEADRIADEAVRRVRERRAKSK